METKETNYKKMLKLNIGIFLCYTILITFIFLFIVFFVKYALYGFTNPILSIALSLISAIVIYHLIHTICKSSILESFKTAKMNKENSDIFLKKMNLFFVICIAISVLICISYLVVDNQIYSTAIENAYNQYNFISPEFTDKVINNIQEEYENTFLGKISSTIIIELSLVVSFFSLIRYQPKVLEKYNN